VQGGCGCPEVSLRHVLPSTLDVGSDSVPLNHGFGDAGVDRLVFAL